MQGRLVPSWNGQLQAFPIDRWEEEFTIASAVGLNSIEWLLDDATCTGNPLWREEECLRIKKNIRDHGMAVSSVCADYLQAFPLTVINRDTRRSRALRLKAVVAAAHELGVQCVLVPCFGKELHPGSSEQDALMEGLLPVLERAWGMGMKVGLEMGWRASDQCRLVDQLSHPALGIYYDFGNATILGYPPGEEIRIIGDRLFGVHLKDRRRNGESVMLGTGDTDLSGGFRALQETGYRGPLILETPRGTDPTAAARQNLAYVRRVMKTYTDSQRS